MSLAQLRAFFGWCTIINMIWLLYATFMARFAFNWLWQWSNQWIYLSLEHFRIVLYLLIGTFKLFLIAFNLVPYIVLAIMSRKHPV